MSRTRQNSNLLKPLPHIQREGEILSGRGADICCRFWVGIWYSPIVCTWPPVWRHHIYTFPLYATEGSISNIICIPRGEYFYKPKNSQNKTLGMFCLYSTMFSLKRIPFLTAKTIICQKDHNIPSIFIIYMYCIYNDFASTIYISVHVCTQCNNKSTNFEIWSCQLDWDLQLPHASGLRFFPPSVVVWGWKWIALPLHHLSGESLQCVPFSDCLVCHRNLHLSGRKEHVDNWEMRLTTWKDLHGWCFEQGEGNNLHKGSKCTVCSFDLTNLEVFSGSLKML